MMKKIEEMVLLLDERDKKKVIEFINIILKQNKYRKLRKEIEKRRKEVKEGKVLSHEEIWKDKKRN